MTDLPVWIMLGLGLGGVAGMIIFMAIFWQPNKDNASDITKNLQIVFVVNLILVAIFAVAAYIYFQANTNYLTPFLLIMNFVNFFLSMFAMSASSLQIMKS